MGNEHRGADPSGIVPCARYAGLAAARFVHPEGVCACFHGGSPPVLLPTPVSAAEADDDWQAESRTRRSGTA
ncbi:MAG: hypothetical protein ACLGIA_10165 [Actinomycetes bacterium]